MPLKTLIRKLESMRSDDTVERLFEQTQSAVEEFNLKMPGVKRLRKTCARYRQTDAAEDLAVEGMKDSWRRSYYEAVDLVSNELSRRFDQAGMKTAAQRERLLISASSQSLASVPELPPLPQNIDKRRLGLQLMMLHDLCAEKPVQDVQCLAKILSAAQPETSKVFNEIENLIELCLSLPVSVAGSERSFSALRRLKTWLRSTMKQNRLTDLALMHVHKDIVDDVNIEALVKEFCSKTPERRSVFGV